MLIAVAVCVRVLGPLLYDTVNQDLCLECAWLERILNTVIWLTVISLSSVIDYILRVYGSIGIWAAVLKSRAQVLLSV